MQISSVLTGKGERTMAEILDTIVLCIICFIGGMCAGWELRDMKK